MTEEGLSCPWCGESVALLSDNRGSLAKIYFCISCHKDFAGPLDMDKSCGEDCIHWHICRVVSAIQVAQHMITEVLSRELAASCLYYRRKG